MRGYVPRRVGAGAAGRLAAAALLALLTAVPGQAARKTHDGTVEGTVTQISDSPSSNSTS